MKAGWGKYYFGEDKNIYEGEWYQGQRHGIV